MNKYAIRIPFDGDYILVTEGNWNDIKVRTFDTEEEAEDHARIWGASAEVVEITEDKNDDER